jgi:hypothetical protein
MKNFNGLLKLKKKKKKRYLKLILFKVLIPYFKSNEKSEVINEIFPQIYRNSKTIIL